MFKYKSPLSRLLEGAGKPKGTEAEEATTPEAEKAEPIADFNALREALAGGNMSSTDSYEETDELIPEEKMPEFSAGEEVAFVKAEDDIVFAEVIDEAQEPEDEAVVSLHTAAEENAESAPEEAVEETLVQVEVAEPEQVEETLVQVEVAEPEQVVDVVTDEPAVQDPVAEAPQEPQPAPAEDRRGRVKTTFLGFERADTHVQDLIETAEPVGKTENAEQSFPVGWLVITGGPGRGASITLTEGLMQIGRNDDQAIQLDFGDTGISRSNHAVIAYDPEDRKCYLGHGGKANLVRLNGKPVLSTVALSSGDLIRISETSIRFAAFCDDGFDWRDS
ncbi:FHA domain-containing protein [Ruegeria sp. Ofav3-42]|uniref:FHA domain-containing protein n=1 Tax=Ruegeria sp. Ofav3-42 TaxID=2917759 RepID=UPI001EF43397|nr:FHA domain-containing protein [Ruegeria sp. Ofav3-42]MCG7520034.1 FHA domain-containing protein [Ruegeria sp. Ofav3-42]